MIGEKKRVGCAATIGGATSDAVSGSGAASDAVSGRSAASGAASRTNFREAVRSSMRTLTTSKVSRWREMSSKTQSKTLTRGRAPHKTQRLTQPRPARQQILPIQPQALVFNSSQEPPHNYLDATLIHKAQSRLRAIEPAGGRRDAGTALLLVAVAVGFVGAVKCCRVPPTPVFFFYVFFLPVYGRNFALGVTVSGDAREKVHPGGRARLCWLDVL